LIRRSSYLKEGVVLRIWDMGFTVVLQL
jgi:hypothetical protein